MEDQKAERGGIRSKRNLVRAAGLQAMLGG